MPFCSPCKPLQFFPITINFDLDLIETSSAPWSYMFEDDFMNSWSRESYVNHAGRIASVTVFRILRVANLFFTHDFRVLPNIN